MDKFIKVIKVLINTLMTLILIIGTAFIILYFVGIEPFVVESGSMQPTIQAGSVSFINKNIKYNNIKENDVIAFKSTNGAKVTHRVIKITKQGFETKGDSNNKSDGISTTQSNYMGKNILSVPKLGNVVKFMQTTKGRIILISIIIEILLAGFFMSDDKKNKGKRFKE